MAWRESPAPKESEISPRENPLHESVRGASGIIHDFGLSSVSSLPRGQTYVRNGSVVDLQIERGQVRAMVSGSELYTARIDVDVGK
jgi:hypothetical protein